MSQEFSSQANQYDVATLSNFEIPIYAGNDWLYPLDDFVAKDPEFDQPDIFPSMTKSLSADGVLYGEPFYGESSFLMYRKDILESKGLTMPERPTWQQVADIAAAGGQRPAGHAGHLPARPAGMGAGHRPADHRGQHLRRHLVRQGLERHR